MRDTPSEEKNSEEFTVRNSPSEESSSEESSDHHYIHTYNVLTVLFSEYS